MTTSSGVAPTSTTVPTSNSSSTSSVSANQLSLNSGLASLADNFQSFMSLLTAQLQNQDPLNPTDTSQFTEEITSMTGVEQQLLSNQLLQQLVTAQSGVTSAANLLGDTITATGSTSSSPDINGVVTGVQQVNGTTELTVGGNQVPLSSVTSVTQGSNS